MPFGSTPCPAGSRLTLEEESVGFTGLAFPVCAWLMPCVLVFHGINAVSVDEDAGVFYPGQIGFLWTTEACTQLS